MTISCQELAFGREAVKSGIGWSSWGRKGVGGVSRSGPALGHRCQTLPGHRDAGALRRAGYRGAYHAPSLTIELSAFGRGRSVRVAGGTAGP